MKLIKLITALFFCFHSKKLQAQNYINLYVPLANISYASDKAISPFCLDINNLRDDNWYWAMNADLLAQGLFNLYTKSDLNINGGIVHARVGYAFWNKNPYAKKGFAFDGPIRAFYNSPFKSGIGLTYFMMLHQKESKLFLMPQVSAGKFTTNGNSFNGGNYFSVEIDVMYKISESTGLSIKPYLFSVYNSSDSQNQFGFKIGFSKYLKLDD